MTRAFQFMVLSCAALVLTGCNAPEKDQPLWQQVKITDLAPSRGTQRPGARLLKTMNFDIYVFEIPAGKIDILDDVWQMLYTKPLRFDDYDAFGANSFSVGFGQTRIWNKVADLLRAAGGKKVETISLLLPDGQANDVAIAILDNEQTIFYVSTEGSMEGVTVGPGAVALRIKAEKIPASRGVCNVSALPVFSPPISSSIPQLAAREKSREFLFSSCRFGLKMSPGDFVFLGPEKYEEHQITLASLLFSRVKPEPAVRTYLIVCTRIVD